MNALRIVFDASLAGAPQRVGIPLYVHQLLAALLRIDHENRYTVLHRRGDAILTGPEDGGPAAWEPLTSPRNYAFWSQVRLPVALAGREFDVLHVPGHRVPWITRGRLVTTIHDLVFFTHPETLRPAHRQRLIWYTRQAARRSARLIAISETTRSGLQEWLDVPAEMIDVVPHGVDHAVFNTTVRPRPVSRPYILSVGTLQPRKNHVTLIRGFRRLCERRKEPIDLLMAGTRGWMYEEIEREARQGPFAERIRLLGYAAESELPQLYRSATLVAIPSLYEGFGLPVLEAMACGAPVVASAIAAFREVAGEAAAFVEPTNVEAWSETMRALLDDEPARQRLQEQGLARARQFTWEETARRTLAVYRRVCAR